MVFIVYINRQPGRHMILDEKWADHPLMKSESESAGQLQ